MEKGQSSQKGDLTNLNHFAAHADGMAARILILPLHLPLAADGWTQQAYSIRQLMSAAGMSYSTSQAEKFSKYIDELIQLGFIEVKADAEKFFYRFAYQKNFSTPTEKILPPETEPEKNLPIRASRARDIDSDSEEEDLNTHPDTIKKSSSQESLNLSPEKKSLLKKHNVLPCYYAFAAEWKLAPLAQLVMNAEKGKEIGIVKSIGGYIATCLEKNELNVPPDNYIQAAAKLEAEQREKEAAEQREREEREAWKQREEERRLERERRKAERAAKPPREFSGLPEGCKFGDNGRDVWLAVLGELQIQLHPAIYRTWVDGARLMGFNGYTAHIGVENDYIRDWLQQRLKTTFERSLTRIIRGSESVQVAFEVEENEDDDLPTYLFGDDDESVVVPAMAGAAD